ncbi:patatin-like phospholipase family protein [Magnetospirillum sulfuroxidans]|uniref:Patatin-like phospholipase family protein n=1 Tax=Magnetospirillum sulfuroxidans TaxID=611300 RepID=A0ABS5IF18_9PROT|nr:patatin-like phospholipase family protein [Magnetospirillum sulfuroxidans]MBR9972368.1 patatin-like phospholipase family protein [Magnetospirillum sulfuroxidans]
MSPPIFTFPWDVPPSVTTLARRLGQWIRGTDAPPPPLSPIPVLAAPPPLPLSETEHVVAIALQGGGAHGAFTWGVLDRLLDEPSIRFDAVSGTSAGAMNAVLLASGLISGGRPGAQALLAAFWRRIAEAGRLSPFRRTWFDHLDGGWSLDRSPWLAFMDMARQFVSPYQTNPLGLNPLQEVLDSLIDFQALRDQDRIAVHVAATNVQTGHPTIFTTAEIDARRVMASACLPFLFQAVEIDGIPYWDGGYTSNPPLLPLLKCGSAGNLVVVPINPPFRPGTPRSAREIFSRINEITFNASLNHNLESLARINALIDQGEIDQATYRRLKLHVIESDDEFHRLAASTKFNTEWDFLVYLRDLGRRAAQSWLARQPWPAIPPPP